MPYVIEASTKRIKKIRMNCGSTHAGSVVGFGSSAKVIAPIKTSPQSAMRNLNSITLSLLFSCGTLAADILKSSKDSFHTKDLGGERQTIGV